MAMTTLAIAWLRLADWPRWVAIDPDPMTYLEWLVRAKDTIEKLEKQGVRVEKITVDPDEFEHWCRTNGKPIRPASRAAYAADLLAERTKIR